ncbi:hypothetical protein [uncultured Algimonas sp.]|uniref:hypothetical protein n=1 Tax=uncultured Algimonas sp. TaxID=1547920 RepID=UPI0026269E11|nr:hypothetical protein [uncultured Algimonas sp.]
MSRQFEDYHGYSIVYNKTGARLLTGDGSLAHPDTFDDLDSAKAWIDTHLSELKGERRAGHIGTVEGYLEALTTQPPNKKEYTMLSAHAAAPDRRMSAQALADLVGWKRDSSAKTHYSKLGRRLAEQLALDIDADDAQAQINAVARTDEDSGEWILHQELADAVEQYSTT